MKRLVFRHHHIFKNAGSTIDFILHKTFGSDFNILPGLNFENVSNLIKEDTVKAISSHVTYINDFELKFIKFIEIAFVRHPLDRLISMYYYYNNSITVDDLSSFAKVADIRDFFGYLVEYQPHQVNNVQVNIFNNSGFYSHPASPSDLVYALHPPSASDLGSAISKIEKMDFIVAVDLFDESIVIAEYFLRPAFSSVDFSYIKQNVSSRYGETVSDRVENFRSEIGQKLFNHLVSFNDLDMILYQKVHDEIHRRSKYIPLFDTKLLEFKSRCDELVGNS